MQTNNKRHNDVSNLLLKLTNDEYDLLLTSVGCALQKCDQLDDSKQAEKELLDLYGKIEAQTIELNPPELLDVFIKEQLVTYTRMDGC